MAATHTQRIDGFPAGRFGATELMHAVESQRSGRNLTADRCIGADDCATVAELVDRDGAHTVRIYAGRFVPNSYRWPRPVERLTLTYRAELAAWMVELDRVDSRRPFGRGARVLVNGRGA